MHCPHCGISSDISGLQGLLVQCPNCAGQYQVPGVKSRKREHRGMMIFVFGLLGLLVFWPLGLVAWIMGGADLREMQRGRMNTDGQSLTQAGWILGIISTLLFVAGLIALIAFWNTIWASFDAMTTV